MAAISFELILFVMSVIINSVILSLVYRFRDLIKLGLLLRRELSHRGYLKIDKDKMKKVVDRLENINLKLKDADF